MWILGPVNLQIERERRGKRGRVWRVTDYPDIKSPPSCLYHVVAQYGLTEVQWPTHHSLWDHHCSWHSVWLGGCQGCRCMMAFYDACMCTIFRIVEMVKCTISSHSQQLLTSDWYSNMCQLSFSVSLEVWYPHETRTQSLPSFPPSPFPQFCPSLPLLSSPWLGWWWWRCWWFSTETERCSGVWCLTCSHSVCSSQGGDMFDRPDSRLTLAWLPPDSQAMITLSLCVDLKVRGESKQTYRQTMMLVWGCGKNTGKNLNIKHVSKNPIFCLFAKTYSVVWVSDDNLITQFKEWVVVVLTRKCKTV